MKPLAELLQKELFGGNGESVLQSMSSCTQFASQCTELRSVVYKQDYQEHMETVAKWIKDKVRGGEFAIEHRGRHDPKDVLALVVIICSLSKEVLPTHPLYNFKTLTWLLAWVQPQELSPSTLKPYKKGMKWSDFQIALIDNSSTFVSVKRWSIEGRGDAWCPTLRERYLAVEKLVNGMYQVLLGFVYDDEFLACYNEQNTDLQANMCWEVFLRPKSLGWKDSGRPTLNLVRCLLRTPFGLQALGPARVIHVL